MKPNYFYSGRGLASNDEQTDEAQDLRRRDAMQVRIDAALTVILSFNGMSSNIPSFALKFNLLGLRSALQDTTVYKVPRFMNPPAYLHAAQHNTTQKLPASTGRRKRVSAQQNQSAGH